MEILWRRDGDAGGVSLGPASGTTVLLSLDGRYLSTCAGDKEGCDLLVVFDSSTRSRIAELKSLARPSAVSLVGGQLLMILEDPGPKKVRHLEVGSLGSGERLWRAQVRTPEEPPRSH